MKHYVVVATDPAAIWRCDLLTVRADSKHEAKRVARGRLAESSREHWVLSFL